MSKSHLSALVPIAETKSDEKENLTLGPTKGPLGGKNDNPALGDHAFYTYCVPGAVFQAKDGTYWDLEDVQGMGYVRIRNKFYPREEITCHVSDVRRTIHAWVEPVQQIVPELVSESA